MTGRVNIKLGDNLVKLWFNRFAIFEFFKIYDIKGDERSNEQLIDIIGTESKHNQMILISNLIWIGAFGFAEANMKDYQLSQKEIRLLVADADISELAKVSEAFFSALGKDLKNEEGDEDKKKAQAMRD